MVTAEQHALAATAAVAAPQQRPSLGAIWAALCTVADPEIPVLSIVDLGMVREVAWDGADPGRLTVRITPTYSGCPAIDVIVASVREALQAIGLPSAEVRTVLSPAWSTTWLTPDAERKLRDYGIAPPRAVTPATGNRAVRIDVRGLAPLRRRMPAVACPRCGSSDTELVAQFGSTACKAQYRCRQCKEPFDYFKPLEG